MRRILLVSSVEVLAAICALERSLIWFALVTVMIGILGEFVIAQRRHPEQKTVAERRGAPGGSSVRTTANDFEVDHRGSAATANRKWIPVYDWRRATRARWFESTWVHC